jgi:hypothetical protein
MLGSQTRERLEKLMQRIAVDVITTRVALMGATSYGLEQPKSQNG